jgi:hypothetical protein
MRINEGHNCVKINRCLRDFAEKEGIMRIGGKLLYWIVLVILICIGVARAPDYWINYPFQALAPVAAVAWLIYKVIRRFIIPDRPKAAIREEK